MCVGTVAMQRKKKREKIREKVKILGILLDDQVIKFYQF